MKRSRALERTLGGIVMLSGIAMLVYALLNPADGLYHAILGTCFAIVGFITTTIADEMD